MNEYRITYTLDGEEHRSNITERTEKAARKRLQGVYKAAEITDVELTDTDASATKEQERETLEKIKAMVAELGSGSYLETAFAGVFEDAETNIENDFAFSMKARVESAEGRAKELEDDLNRTHQRVLELERELNDTQVQIAALTKRQLSPGLHGSIYNLVTEELASARERMAQSADTMAYFADAPQDIAFADAVKSYRAAKERREACEQIVAALEQLTEE